MWGALGGMVGRLGTSAWDYFSKPDAAGTGGMNYVNASEVGRINDLGQDAPMTTPGGEPIDYVGPDDYMPPAEQGQLFPRGLPSQDKAGGLADLAYQSRIKDALTQNQSTGEQRSDAKGAMEEAAGGTYKPGQAGAGVWYQGAPDAFAKATQKGRESEAYHNIGKLVGKIAAMAAGGAAGGAGGGAGGAGGAGAGAAGATSAQGATMAVPTGAAGGAAGAGGAGGAGGTGGFGGQFMQGFQGQGGEGMGSMLGGYARRQMLSGGGGGGGPMGGGGGGGGGGGMGGMMDFKGQSDAQDRYFGIALGDDAEEEAALAEAGLLFDPGLRQNYWGV